MDTWLAAVLIIIGLLFLLGKTDEAPKIAAQLGRTVRAFRMAMQGDEEALEELLGRRQQRYQPPRYTPPSQQSGEVDREALRRLAERLGQQQSGGGQAKSEGGGGSS